MNDRFTGFVLNISDYRDNDILMQVASKDYGIISLIGKGSKKVAGKNRFLSCCLYEFIIDYKDKKTIYTVHGSKLIESYFEDRDIEMMTLKNLLCELALKNREIDSFDELRFVFEHLQKENRFLLSCMYLSFLIKRFGVTPLVDGCALCGSSKVVAVSNSHGGFLCLKHRGGEDVLPVDRLKKFRLIIKASFENYEVIKDFQYDSKDLDLLMSFYQQNSDLHLNSYDFYRKVL